MIISPGTVGRRIRVESERNDVRWAVIEGLAWHQKSGANPFKLGFVAGTDDHNASRQKSLRVGRTVRLARRSRRRGWIGRTAADGRLWSFAGHDACSDPP
jgi:hypothetical protein